MASGNRGHFLFFDMIRLIVKQLVHQLKLFNKYFLTKRAANGPIKQGDFDMYLEPVDIHAYIESLTSSALPSKVIGEVTYENTCYPILQLDKYNENAKQKLLIFAGVHGNEFAAALAVQDLITDIHNHPVKYENWNIRIVAPLNPIGLSLGSRYNEDGYDINRDFKNFHSLGARIQRDTILEFQPDMLVTLHEGPHEGFFMISEGKLPKKLRNTIYKSLTDAEIPLARRSFLHIKPQMGIWNKPRLVFLLQRVFGIYTLGRFTHDRNIPTITTESSWVSNDVNIRRKSHLQVITAIVENLALL